MLVVESEVGPGGVERSAAHAPCETVECRHPKGLIAECLILELCISAVFMSSRESRGRRTHATSWDERGDCGRGHIDFASPSRTLQRQAAQVARKNLFRMLGSGGDSHSAEDEGPQKRRPGHSFARRPGFRMRCRTSLFVESSRIAYVRCSLW